MPRTHALLAALAAFVIGLIVGGTAVFTSPYRVQVKALEHLRKENVLLRQVNDELTKYKEEVDSILRRSEAAEKP